MPPPATTEPLDIERLLATLGDRERSVVEALFRGEPAGTGQRLAGSDSTRVHALFVAALAHLMGRLRTPPHALLRMRIAALRAGLGSAAPLDSATVRRLIDGCTEHAPDPVVYRHLALALAGTYHVRDGWLLRDDAPSASALDATADRHGLVSLGDARDLLLRSGVRAPFHDAWMAQLRRWVRHGETLLPTRGGITDRAVALLAAHGAPLPLREIIALFGDTRRPHSVSQALSEDPRIARFSRTVWALHEWGLPAYTTISDAVASHLAAHGGEASPADLMAAISSHHGVSPHSVQSYINAPRFTSTGGRVRLALAARPRRDSDPRFVQGLFCHPDGSVSLLLTVTHDTLRGSGRLTAAAFPTALGMQPGDRRIFTLPDGTPIPVAWPSFSFTGAYIGSLRHAAHALGVRHGDYMRLTLTPASARAEIVPAPAHCMPDDPIAAVRLLTGIAAPGHALARMTADAISTSPAGVLAILDRRGDPHVAAYLAAALDQSGGADARAALHRRAAINRWMTSEAFGALSPSAQSTYQHTLFTWLAFLDSRGTGQDTVSAADIAAFLAQLQRLRPERDARRRLSRFLTVARHFHRAQPGAPTSTALRMPPHPVTLGAYIR